MSDMSSKYERTLMEEANDGKRSLIYIRNRIGEIGLPCGIPVLSDAKSSVWPSNDSLSNRLSKKEEVQEIRLVGSLRACRMARS